LAHSDDALDAATQATFETHTQRRLNTEPVAYITGQKEYFGLTLQVDHRVLDPRADTETLVEWALSDLWSWTREVQNRMPGAQTQLWRSTTDPQHMGIGVAWRDPDKTGIAATNHPPGLNCPAQHRCFWMHVRP
jgi:hypothetical protein